MSIYNNSKVYKIYSSLGDNIYIGSTYRSLADRYDEHVSSYKLYTQDNNKNYTSSFILFDKYGFENCKIKRLESVDVETRTELLQVEAKHIKINKDKCVNKNLPFCTPEEKIEHRKEHLQLPETIEHRKEYRNQPDQVQSRRDYNQQKYNCDCGFQCKNQPAVKEGHFRSPNHQQYMKLKEKLLLASKTTIINNITNNIQTVITMNNFPKTEKEELEELEKELENSQK